MGKTTIEWTDFSINPIRARHKITSAVGHYCEKISAGCAKCYSSNFQKRFGMPAFNEQRGDDLIEPFLDESKFLEVIHRKKPTRWFWCDMTDMFGSWVPDEWIDKCFAVMALTPQHTHQVLTKRPERMWDYFSRPDRHNEIELAADALQPGNGHASFGGKHLLPKLPLPNVWLGTSIEDQASADTRIPLLLKTPATVRFISAEPLLGSLDLHPWLSPRSFGRVAQINDNDAKEIYELRDGRFLEPLKLDLVICGGESGHGARPMREEWVRSIKDQCVAAGVSFFYKQKIEAGKKVSLPVLDGQQWSQIPQNS